MIAKEQLIFPAQVWCSKEMEPLREKVKPIINRIDNKPDGGMWTSTYIDDDDPVSSPSEWYSAATDMFRMSVNRVFLLIPEQYIRRFIIDSLDDLLLLIKQYPCDCSGKYASFLAGRYINYEDFFKEYDCLTLTSEGQCNTRFSSPADLYGWDSECTLWKRWAFTKVMEIKRKG